VSQSVVIDINAPVSGLLAREPDSSLCAVLDGMINGSLTFLLSPRLLAEYRAVLLRPRVRKCHGLSVSEVDAILTEIAANGIWREPDEPAPAPDLGDDHLWRLLSTVPGSILITGDQLLLQNPPGNASVLSPRSYFELERWNE